MQQNIRPIKPRKTILIYKTTCFSSLDFIPIKGGIASTFFAKSINLTY
jgi:hypothetical protein